MEKFIIDDAWDMRPWKDDHHQAELGIDGMPQMKRCKNGRVEIDGVTFPFSIYETKTQGYLFRGHMSVTDPSDNKVMLVSGKKRQETVDNLSARSREMYNDGKRIRELMIGKDFFVQTDDPETIRRKVMGTAVDLYAENSRQICARQQKLLAKDLTAIVACNARGAEFIRNKFSNTTEEAANSKLTSLKKVCVLISEKPMEDVKETDIRRLKNRLAKDVQEQTARGKLKILDDFWEYCLGKHIINGQNPVSAYLQSNPGSKRKDPEALADKESRARSLTSAVEQTLNKNIEANISDGRTMSIVLLNGGGIMPTLQKGMRWNAVSFGESETEATVAVRRDDILGGTHDFTRPLFPDEACMLRLRFDYLMSRCKGDEKYVRDLPIVSKKDDPTAELTEPKEITGFIRDALLRAGVKNSQLASSRNQNPRVGMGTQLLRNNYEAKILECGVDSDSGLKDFLLIRRINSVTGDRYRSYTSDEGQRYISNLLNRLGCSCREQTKRPRKNRFKEDGKEIIRIGAAGDGYCNALEVEFKLKKGDVLSIESGLGADGTICVSGIGAEEKNAELSVELY